MAMKIYFLTVCLVGVVCCVPQPFHAHGMKKIFLSVYYESLCPDSRDFILQQLRPALQILHKQLVLRLVPFGKAEVINSARGTFRCQHGPPECLGNRVQSCALHYMSRRSDLAKLDYVACEMSTQAGTRGNLSCVKKSNVSTEAVSRCVNSQQGTELQEFAASQTMVVAPQVVPTITVNRVFNQNTQYHAIADLLGMLCLELQNSVYCSQHFNKLALKEIMS